ncbi:MAG TPA: YceI family protein [Flavobacteriales bacterium]|nr:YceI family protein [Flavobacteriales bacterium]
MLRTLAIAAMVVGLDLPQDKELLRLERSRITFLSEAPMETITAANTRSTGLLDPATRSFAVQVPMAEFEGFNSPLQREHFNENYLESAVHPKATFKGRIIEAVDLRTPGTHTIRAKGELSIKGIVRERIVPCTMVVSANEVRITGSFDVALDEHEIRVPRVVQQKIAPVVQVKLDLLFSSSPAK